MQTWFFGLISAPVKRGQVNAACKVILKRDHLNRRCSRAVSYAENGGSIFRARTFLKSADNLTNPKSIQQRSTTLHIRGLLFIAFES